MKTFQTQFETARARSTNLELVFFPIDDDCRNLLIHENENGGKEGWEQTNDWQPEWILRRKDRK